jgi:hypothetical protein
MSISFVELVGQLGTYLATAVGMVVVSSWVYKFHGSGTVHGKAAGKNIYSVLDLIKMPDRDFIAAAGLNAHVFVRTYLLGVKLTALFIPAGWCILVPVYASVANDGEIDLLQVLSASHVPQDDERLSGPVVTTYILSAITMVLFFREFRYFVSLRQAEIRDNCKQHHKVIDQPTHPTPQ